LNGFAWCVPLSRVINLLIGLDNEKSHVLLIQIDERARFMMMVAVAM
jgi:hypothetical protein